MTFVFILIAANQWPWLEPIEWAAQAKGHQTRVFSGHIAEVDAHLARLRDVVVVSVLGVAERSHWSGPWIGIQHRVTDLLFLKDPTRYAAVCVWSPIWLDWFAQYRDRVIHPVADEAVSHTVVESLRGRARTTGATLLDQAARSDPATIRHRYGLPERFVVYLPFPLRTAGEGWWAHAYTSAWPWGTEWHLVRALRHRCDEAGVGLVMKGRGKNPIPARLRRLADATIPADNAGEPTLLRVLEAGAARVYHWMSASVVEAAIAGVPSVCLAPQIGRWPPYDERRRRVPALDPLAVGPGFYAGWGMSIRGVHHRDASMPISPPLSALWLTHYRAHVLGESGAGARIVEEAERCTAQEATTT